MPLGFDKPELRILADISFVEVLDAGAGWTKVLASDGNTYTFDGNRNWRNNNPGNLEYGPFAKSMGAIGTDGRFAVFPTYDDGVRAQATLQFESPSYRDLSIQKAIERYAPSFENDVAAYVNSVTGGSGVTADTKMSELSPQQKAAFLAAQQSHEGFVPGKVKGEEGKPVPFRVAQQFKAVRLPAVDIGLGTGQVTARDNIETQRAEQELMRSRVVPAVPERRPTTVGGNALQPLPAPAPLNASNPLQKPADLASGAKPGSKYPRIGNFSTETRYAAGAGRGAKAEITYKAPAPASPTVPPRRPDTPPKETPRQMATLPSGKPVEVGRIYTINGKDYIGGVKDGVGTLIKAPTSIIDEATGKSIVGQAVRDKVVEEVGKGIKSAAAAAPKLAQDAFSGLSSVAGNIGETLGNVFSDRDDVAAQTKERSPALASALARLGAQVATKAKIDLGQRPRVSGTASGTLGATGKGAARVDLKPGVINTAAPYQEPIPFGVRPSSVPAPDVLKKLVEAAPRVTTPQGPQRRASAQPQYITKSRQVLVEEEAPKASLKSGAALSGGAAGASLKPITLSGSATGIAGAQAAGRGSLTYTAPVKKAPVYKTETYQERNPLYVAPKGPTPEEIAAYKRLQAEKAEAVRIEEEKRKAAALAASQPKITGVGGGGAYLTTPFQEDRFQTTTNSLMPASTNNSRWQSGY